jgi:hypothetical protein
MASNSVLRHCEEVTTHLVIARRYSDEAIHPVFNGLLRCARNDAGRAATTEKNPYPTDSMIFPICALLSISRCASAA